MILQKKDVWGQYRRKVNISIIHTNSSRYTPLRKKNRKWLDTWFWCLKDISTRVDKCASIKILKSHTKCVYNVSPSFSINRKVFGIVYLFIWKMKLNSTSSNAKFVNICLEIPSNLQMLALWSQYHCYSERYKILFLRVIFCIFYIQLLQVKLFLPH